MPILNYTTQIAPEKTISEISKCLSRHGVTAIMTVYHNNEAVGLSFSMAVNAIPVNYQLPLNWKGVLQAMMKDKKVPRHCCRNDQALRTAWRILKDWIEAQMALIDAEQASVAEIFLPYATTRDGRTLYQLFQDTPNKLIGQ